MLWNISVEDGMAKKKLVGFLIFLILVLVLLWKVPVKDIFQGELLRYLQSLVEENFLLAALVYVLLCALAGAFLALPGISYALLAGISCFLGNCAVHSGSQYFRRNLFSYGEVFLAGQHQAEAYAKSIHCQVFHGRGKKESSCTFVYHKNHSGLSF